MHRLSLRLRIFLFFALLALGGTGLAVLAAYMGYRRAGHAGPEAGFLLSAIVAGFGLPALAAGIWLLFDENVAKPIERLAAGLRVSAAGPNGTGIDGHSARYLGDLAPAAQAVSQQLSQTMLESAAQIAAKTAALQAEKDRLISLLTEVPVAMIVANANHQIVLYDGQAAEALAQVAPPRLNASLFDYFEPQALQQAYSAMAKTGKEVALQAQGVHGQFSFDARMKPLDAAQGYMLVIDDAHAQFSPDAMRPITYDFALIAPDAATPLDHRPLGQLAFMVFDTETTGLLPHKDDIVQLGAVRVLNGRIIENETLDQLVNPGRPIPPASSRVHGITDAMVAGAPSPQDSIALLHHFARDAVIVSHNAPFDMAFLRRYGAQAGLDWPHPVLDTVLLSAVLFGASQTHTLDALCARLGLVIPPHLRHTALGDAYATAQALVAMLPMLQARGLDSLGAVIAQTRKHGRLLQDLNG